MPEHDGRPYRRLVVAPRGHAKSTLVALLCALHAALYKLEPYIVIYSATAKQASQILMNLKYELKQNERILADFGRLVDSSKQGKDNDADVILTNGVRIQAFGAEASTRGLNHYGQRPTLIILDDIESTEGMMSKDQRDKLKTWLVRDVEPMVDRKRSKIIIVGNRLHQFDLISEKMLDPDWDHVLYKAVLPDGSLLWPGFWSEEGLAAEKRRLGPFAFNAEYMNEPVDESTKMFRKDWLRYYKTQALPEDLETFAAIDPAISEKTKSDYFVCITIGRSKATGDMYLLDIYRNRGTLDEHLDAVVHRYLRYDWRIVGFEEVGFQKVLQTHFVKTAAASKGVSLPARQIKAKGEKYIRIQRLQPIFENSRMYIRDDMRDFIEEYDCYPNVDHDDQLDALDMAVQLADAPMARIRLI